MVRDALEFRQKTGIDGLNLSPHQLSIEMQALRANDRYQKKLLAESVMIAMSGDKELFGRLMSE